MNKDKLKRAESIIMGIYSILPDEYTDDTELIVVESDEQRKEILAEHEELLELDDCEAFYIENTNIIVILYYLPFFDGMEGDLNLVFSLLHELRHLYQDRKYGDTLGDFLDDEECELDASDFAATTMRENYDYICSLIGCKEFTIDKI